LKLISSRDNPFFKTLLRLAGSARHRKESAQTLLDGAHLVQAYLAAGHRPLHVLVTEAGREDGEVAALLKKIPEVPLTQLSEQLFAELSGLRTPNGLMGLIELPLTDIAAADSQFCLLLEDIQDPGNLGSMLRSAAAAGCDAVFLSSGCADAWSPKVLRAGMGGHFALGIHESVDLPAVAAAFRGRLLAALPDGPCSLYDCDLRGRLAFAVGNEGAGLSIDMRAAASILIAIPMPGKIESLNAAAAVAVCLFEAVRQR
jgi:TrmH family RNA methyltransferase